MRKGPLLVGLVAAIVSLAAAQVAAAKNLGPVGAAQDVVVQQRLDGRRASYRYVTVSPGTKPRLTVIERIDVRDGRIDRWWYLRGQYFIAAAAYDGSAAGVSTHGNVLVLNRFAPTDSPQRTKLAVLDTNVFLRHPLRPGQHRPPHAIRRLSLPGYFVFEAISPDGSKLYLRRYRTSGLVGSDDFGLRVLDTRSGELAPRPLAAGSDGRPLAGLMVSGGRSPDGRWAYGLYDGDRHKPFLLALDTVAGRVVRVDLPGLERLGNPYLLKLRVEEGGRRLVVLARSPQSGRLPSGAKALISVDLERLEARTPAPPIAAASRFLSFAGTPRRPGNVLERTGVAGRSADGRPIGLRQLGDPALDGRVLVFGCIHGDECAARRIEPLTNGCPDPRSNVFVVPNLDPDGLAAGTRLNGRGVDLNRNFPAGWRPIGRRGDPQYSGPSPLSEPEARLAVRIVERLRPRVTIWFHQHSGGPLVRAWGQSAPAGRLFAHLARLPLRLLPWPAGTAPNWQNHRFPGTGSYVVELPPGPLTADLGSRIDKAIVRIGRREATVGED